MRICKFLAKLRGGVSKSGVEKALEVVGLHKEKRKVFSDYSLGMKQRLGIAAAIMHEPELLILDEPINGLDPIGIVEIRSFLSELSHNHGITIFISSHVLSEIEQIADIIGVMHEGHLVEEVNISELHKRNRKYIQFDLSDSEIAGKILENHYHMTDFTVQDGTVRIYDFSQSVGEINREFARNGLLVTRINDSEENLEDYFSKLLEVAVLLNLISCELLKLKRSKMVLISVAGVLSTPLLMLIEALQTHFDKPEIIFTLSDIYSDSVLYIMLLVNIMIYVAIAAYLFSREYTESTLKTILPIPISRTKLLIGKFCTLLLWIVMLTLVTWAGIFIVCGLYDAVFTLEGYSLLVAIVWLPKFLFGSILMFLTVSPFVFVAMKTKGFVAPMIGSAVIVMGSAALSNQEWGALYPWTATYFLVQGKLQSTGYPTLLSVSIIILVSAVGFLMTFHHFKKEDLK